METPKSFPKILLNLHSKYNISEKIFEKRINCIKSFLRNNYFNETKKTFSEIFFLLNFLVQLKLRLMNFLLPWPNA